MGRGTKKGKIISLLRQEFSTVVAIQQDNQSSDDQVWVVFINNAVQLRFRIIENYIVYVTGIKPLGVVSIDDICKKIIGCFSKQTRYTVLIDTLENTTKLCDVCVQMDFPCASNPIYSDIPYETYQRLRDYYRADDAQCGYYIIAIADKPETVDQSTSDTDVNSNSDRDESNYNKAVVSQNGIFTTDSGGICRIGCVSFIMHCYKSNTVGAVMYINDVTVDKSNPERSYVSDCYGVYQGFLAALRSEIINRIIIGPTVDSDFCKLFRPQTKMTIYDLADSPSEIVTEYSNVRGTGTKVTRDINWFMLTRGNSCQ